MKDFLGNEVNVGDTVAVIRVGYKYLTKGTVESLTQKGFKVRIKTPWGEDVTQRYSDQVIKI